MRIPYDIYDDDSDGIELGKVNPCPFCGKTDKLIITAKHIFRSVHEETGGGCITLECHRCNAGLTEYDNDNVGYDVKAGILVARWNNRRYKNVGD